MKHPFGKLLLTWCITISIGTLLVLTVSPLLFPGEVGTTFTSTTGAVTGSIGIFIFLWLATLPEFLIFYLIAIRISSDNLSRKTGILVLLAFLGCIGTTAGAIYITAGARALWRLLDMGNLLAYLVGLILPFLLPFIVCIFAFDFSHPKKSPHFDFDDEPTIEAK